MNDKMKIINSVQSSLQKNDVNTAAELIANLKQTIHDLSDNEQIILLLTEIEYHSLQFHINEAFSKWIELQVLLVKKKLTLTPFFIKALFLIVKILDQRGLITFMEHYLQQVEELLTAISELTPKEIFNFHCQLLVYKGLIFSHRGKFNEAKSTFLEALAIAEILNDKLMKTRIYLHVGFIARDANNLDEALEYFNMALRFSKDYNNPILIAQCYNNIGTILDLKGQLDDAIKMYHKGLQLAKNSQNFQLLGNLYNNIGIIYRLKGQPEKALSYYSKCIKYWEKTCNPRLLGICHHNMATTYWDLGKYDESLHHEELSLDYKKLVGNQAEIAISLNVIGIIHGIKGELNEALNYFMEALSLLQENKNHAYLPNILSNIGYAYYSRGNLSTAIEYFNQSLKLGRNSSYSPLETANVILNIGLCYLRMGWHEEAKKHLLDAKKTFLEYSQEQKVANVIFNLITLYLDQHDLINAKQELNNLSRITSKHRQNEYLKQLHSISKAAVIKSETLQFWSHPKDLRELGLLFIRLSIAEKLLSTVLQGELIDYELKVLASLHQCEILLLKAEIFEDQSYIDETDHLIEQILQLATSQNSHLLTVQAQWLKAKLFLVKTQLMEALNIIETALSITQKQQLGQIETLLLKEKDFITKMVTKNVTTTQLSLNVRLEMAKITEALWCLQGRKINCNNSILTAISPGDATNFIKKLQRRFKHSQK